MWRYLALLHYLLFWTITQLFYFPTWNAGFVTDFTGLLNRFEGRTASGILDCFGFPALQQVLNTILYSWHSLFGISPLPWYLLQSSLHALNAWLLLQLGKALSVHLQLSNARLIGWMAALLFLVSPYASEPVTWRVAQNFLLSTAIILGTSRLTIKWSAFAQLSHWVWIQILFVLGLFTFELVLIVPFVSSLLLFVLPGGTWAKWRRLSLPQFAGVAGYFLLNRAILGSWVGHYGAEVHLKFDLQGMLGNALRYALKHLLFVRDWPHHLKQGLFEGLLNPWIAYGLTGTLIIGLIAGLAVKNRLKARFVLIMFALLSFGLALAPILNLYFNYTLHLENDRYGYLASAFLMLGLAAALSALPKWGRLPFLITYLGISSYFLWQHNQYWWKSTQVYHQMLNTFEAYEAPEVYLLNLPDNFQGAPMFRDYSGEDLAFRDALKYIKRKPYQGKIFEVAQYNMTRLTDGATAKRDSTGLIRVEFNQWGNWWWRRGIGMGPGYDTDSYTVNSKGHHYFLESRKAEQGAVFLFQEALEWKEVG